MTCEQARAHLEDRLDGTLPASDAQELEAHLAACTECARERESLDRVEAALLASGSIRLAPPQGLVDAALHRIEHEGHRSIRREIAALLATAAVFLAALLAFEFTPGDVTEVPTQISQHVEGFGGAMAAGIDQVTNQVNALWKGKP
jgi:anti-sigma factor RsiW